MDAKEAFKLSVFLLFAGAVFAAGFIFGMAREEDVWTRAAIDNKVAQLIYDAEHNKWVFHWRRPPEEPKPAAPVSE